MNNLDERKNTAISEIERTLLRIMKDNPSYPDAAKQISSRMIKAFIDLDKDIERDIVLTSLISFCDTLASSLKDGKMGTSKELSLIKNQIRIAQTAFETELKRRTSVDKLPEEKLSEFIK